MVVQSVGQVLQSLLKALQGWMVRAGKSEVRYTERNRQSKKLFPEAALAVLSTYSASAPRIAADRASERGQGSVLHRPFCWWACVYTQVLCTMRLYVLLLPAALQLFSLS